MTTNNIKIEEKNWYRGDLDEITVFWHVNENGCIEPYSHAHNDVLSFVLYWRGQPVIIDPGRYNYGKSPLGVYGKKVRAHNSILLDDYEPFPLTRYVYPPNYRNNTVSVDYNETQDELYLKITHDGFKRINKNFHSYREFYLSDNRLKISDKIEGGGVHNIKTFFHFSSQAKNLAVDGGIVNLSIFDAPMRFSVFSNSKPKMQIVTGLSGQNPMGWFFPDYNEVLPSNSLVCETDAGFPYEAEYIMDFG